MQELQAGGDTAGLSNTFLKTGVPETREDYFYMTENKDKYDAAFGETAASGNESKALQMVNNILGGNVEGITGAVRTGNIPGISQITGSATTQTDWEGLQSLLSLAKRGELKGSGQVSDFETRMLEKAALAGLDQRLPAEEFKRRLLLLKNDLESGGASDNTQSQQQNNNDPLGIMGGY